MGGDFLGGTGGGVRPLLVAATGLLFLLGGFRPLELSLAEPEEKDLDLDLELGREPDVEEEDADPENEEEPESDPDGDAAALPRAGFAMASPPQLLGISNPNGNRELTLELQRRSSKQTSRSGLHWLFIHMFQISENNN